MRVVPLLAPSSSQPAATALKPVTLPRPLALWHLASLDAPTVAVVWSLAFAWSTGLHLQWWIPIVQALGAWTVYVADRLLDARRALLNGATDTLRERHYFHWRRRRILLPLALVAAFVCAVMIFVFMPVTARERNSVLAVATLAYMARVHAADEKKHADRQARLPFLTKELLVGILFTAGCALPALAQAIASNRQSWLVALPALFFAALAWLNCYAIDRWESPGPPSAAVACAAIACAACGCVLAGALALSHPKSCALAVAGTLSCLLLALLDRSRRRLSPLALRASADLVLLTPVILLLR